MDLFKLDKYDKYFVAFILIIITLFNIGKCFASEIEEVEFSTVPNLLLSRYSNAFSASSNNSVGYFELERGYIYHITNENPNDLNVATSNEIPSVNVTYNYLFTLPSNTTYDYIANNTYLYFDLGRVNYVTVTREKIVGQENAINGLVENVGVNQLWNVFEGGIDFVGVIVLVAFGLFLVFLLIKKLSKGKADF